MSAPPPRSLSTAVLDALDTGWGALVERIGGMDDAEYLWTPVSGCWTVREQGDGSWRADWSEDDPQPAPITTIAWRCWHVAVDALDSYSGRLFGSGGTGLSGNLWVGSAADALRLMDEAWGTFRAGVAGWSDEMLFAPLGPAWGPYANRTHLDIALHANREVVHHGAEIALLRDLYPFTKVD